MPTTGSSRIVLPGWGVHIGGLEGNPNRIGKPRGYCLAFDKPNEIAAGIGEIDKLRRAHVLRLKLSSSTVDRGYLSGGDDLLGHHHGPSQAATKRNWDASDGWSSADSR